MRRYEKLQNKQAMAGEINIKVYGKELERLDSFDTWEGYQNKMMMIQNVS